MKTHPIHTFQRAWTAAGLTGLAILCPALLLSAFFLLPRAQANPPGLMAYQGFLVGSDGIALGVPTPRNYDVVFRIFDAATGGNPLWAEQQTVTVDKGYFSVLLGQGGEVAGEPRPSLMSVFAHGEVALRYIGITVKIQNEPDLEIAPRLQLISSPYAFAAGHARALVSPSGATVATTANGQLSVLGSLSFGAAGEYQAPAATEPLRVVRGSLDANGVVTAGEGFESSGFTIVTTKSAAIATTNYLRRIAFIPPFSEPPSVSVTPIATVFTNSFGDTFLHPPLGTGAFIMNKNTNGFDSVIGGVYPPIPELPGIVVAAYTNVAFDFIAIGRR